MLLLLERSISPSFTFPPSRTPHQTLLIRESPFDTSHHPLLFYLLISAVSEMMNFLLWVGGFKYYGSSRSGPFPLFFERGNKRSLDRLIESGLDKETRRIGNTVRLVALSFFMRSGERGGFFSQLSTDLAWALINQSIKKNIYI